MFASSLVKDLIIMMRKVSFILIVLSVCFYSTQAQTKVTEEALKGEWKMVFSMLEEELEDESVWEWMFGEAVSEFVFDILEDVDIQFEFYDNHRARMTVRAYGDKEVEYLDWYINRQGELIIGDEDDDEVWLFEQNKLIAYKKTYRNRLKNKKIYLERIR